MELERYVTARRFNQSILKEISPGISLEGMMLKLKLQYFGHLMQRVDSLEKILEIPLDSIDIKSVSCMDVRFGL